MPPSTDDVALRLSIEDLGTLEPITLYEDKVLDGRARLRVNQQLGRSVEEQLAQRQSKNELSRISN